MPWSNQYAGGVVRTGRIPGPDPGHDGDGELPDNLIPFHQNLAEKRPDLSHLRYGVIALGDQTYADTYCNAGRTFDALLAELGAHKVGERLEIDACTQPLPDEDALDWAKEWVEML